MWRCRQGSLAGNLPIKTEIMAKHKTYPAPELSVYDIEIKGGFDVSMGFNAGVESGNDDSALGIDDMSTTFDNGGW